MGNPTFDRIIKRVTADDVAMAKKHFNACLDRMGLVDFDKALGVLWRSSAIVAVYDERERVACNGSDPWEGDII